MILNECILRVYIKERKAGKRVGREGKKEGKKGRGKMIKTVVVLAFNKLISSRECAAEQRTSSWLRARVAKGLRAPPLRQFRRAKESKAEQG